MYQKLLHVLFPILCLLALFWLTVHFWYLFVGNYLYSLLSFGLLLLTNLFILLVNHSLMGESLTKPTDLPQSQTEP